LIPEGGYNPLGAHGASLIVDHIPQAGFTHIATAMGTSTTLAGLVLKAPNTTQLIGVSVLKGATDMHHRLEFLTQTTLNWDQVHIWEGYHFGGYGKQNKELLDFMNKIWDDYALPLDFVYTGKLF
jgi:1-aminocyclopropane-1-carboxylate deaminase